MKKRNSKLSQESKEECYEFIRWYKKHLNCSNLDLAKELEVSKTTIFAWLNGKGVGRHSYNIIMAKKLEVMSKLPEVEINEREVVIVNIDQDEIVDVASMSEELEHRKNAKELVSADMTQDETLFWAALLFVIIAYIGVMLFGRNNVQDGVAIMLLFLIHFLMRIVDFTIKEYVNIIRCFARGYNE